MNELLFNVMGKAAKESLKRVFLEVMVRAAASEAGRAVVKGAGSAAKKLRQTITRWRPWEIVGIEVVVEGA